MTAQAHDAPPRTRVAMLASPAWSAIDIHARVPRGEPGAPRRVRGMPQPEGGTPASVARGATRSARSTASCTPACCVPGAASRVADTSRRTTNALCGTADATCRVPNTKRRASRPALRVRDPPADTGDATSAVATPRFHLGCSPSARRDTRAGPATRSPRREPWRGAVVDRSEGTKGTR